MLILLWIIGSLQTTRSTKETGQLAAPRGNALKSLTPEALAENITPKKKTLQATRVPERERLPQQRRVVPCGSTVQGALLDEGARNQRLEIRLLWHQVFANQVIA